jgi:hypothetical protein
MTILDISINLRNFCIFSKPGDDRSDIVRKVKSMNSSLIEIDNSRFYFSSRSDEWQQFKFEQVVPIIDNKFTIRHPSDKLFSRSGFNINTVLEIDGLADMSLPKSLDLGKIFSKYENGVVQPSFNDVIQSQIFSRISSKGLAFAFIVFNITNLTYHTRIWESTFVRKKDLTSS